MDIIVKILKNLWVNVFIILLLTIAIISCMMRYRKGSTAYKYYVNFTTGLLIIWILQIFQRSVSPRTVYGLLMGLLIGGILIFSLFNFYLGYKKEKAIKT